MDNPKILLIDDDPAIWNIASQILAFGGFEAFFANSGQEGLRQLYHVQPALVLLAIMMPEMDGLEVLKRILQLTDVPVIMLSALTHTDVIVRALELGADDYIKKPFEKDELLARIHSVLRRTAASSAMRFTRKYQDGYLAMDLQENRVWVEDKPVRLTATEYKFLGYLYLHRGKVCTYSRILENVWGGVTPNDPHNVHVYVQKIRNKIEKDPNDPKYVRTEYGIGYRFEKQKR